jgi:hypothetical protein
MKRRVGLWAVCGFVVACYWVIYGIFTWPNNLGHSAALAITAPASFVGRAMPLKYYWFILLNAAVYAMFGLATEPFWRGWR